MVKDKLTSYKFPPPKAYIPALSNQTKNTLFNKVRIFTLILCLICSFSSEVNAQKILICDAVTRFPIKDVEVKADRILVGRTSYLGEIILPKTFNVVSFRSNGYLLETLYRNEVPRDTMFLYPSENTLNEVVVWGKYRVNVDQISSNMPRRDLKDFGYIAPVKKLINGGYDVATMLDKRLRRDRKHVTKLREIFEKLDGKDPIERAYTKEVEENSVRNFNQ